MKVKELIEELQKCPQDWIVMYDFENSYTNDETERMYGIDREPRTFSMGIDDVMIGSGTQRGFVYLAEELIKEIKDEKNQSL